MDSYIFYPTYFIVDHDTFKTNKIEKCRLNCMAPFLSFGDPAPTILSVRILFKTFLIRLVEIVEVSN